MRILGIDLGSREVKIVVMDEAAVLIRKKISTMSFYRDYCRMEDRIVVDLPRLNLGPIDKAISTGYGKNNTDLAFFKTINEVKAHVYGAVFQTNEQDFILLDVGGQDVKIVNVRKGIINDLELNDKCAASCGRYLENMAAVLETDIHELGRHHDNPHLLNATCAVFSESELIGKVAEGLAFPQLCASVNFALYNRLKPMFSRFMSKKLILAGGVASNSAIAHYLKSDYDEVMTVADPQFNGAIGCCRYGLKYGS